MKIEGIRMSGRIYVRADSHNHVTITNCIIEAGRAVPKGFFARLALAWEIVRGKVGLLCDHNDTAVICVEGAKTDEAS